MFDTWDLLGYWVMSDDVWELQLHDRLNMLGKKHVFIP